MITDQKAAVCTRFGAPLCMENIMLRAPRRRSEVALDAVGASAIRIFLLPKAHVRIASLRSTAHEAAGVVWRLWARRHTGAIAVARDSVVGQH